MLQKNKKKKNRFSTRTILKNRLVDLFVVLVILGLFGSGATIIWASTLKIPDFNSFSEARKITQSTKIYDRTGEVVLFDIHKDIKRTIIPFKEISRHIKNATIAIEDSQFYEHNGVKPTAIIRSLLTNIQSGNLTASGGSTITQQVVKNSVLTREKSITRKLKEAILSIKIERVMDKDAIFSLYLNEIPYGGNIYGVQEASQRFFGKNATDITLAESAYLAALPKAPTYYSPYGNNKDRLDERKDIVLSRMRELGFITESEEKEAKEEEVLFTPPENINIRAPHFVTFIKLYLEEKYGKETVETGGLKVITTLDWNLQQKAEEIVKKFGEEN
ncbi:MAG: carboxypeptidase, partial [Candidatus Levybacteria bacterium CG10_big_fil_rev_8_21_14_0_10_36_7]